MSRWKAGAIHLGISLIAAALVGSLIYFVWYPPPYFEVSGGGNLMLIIMSVDVVIGPLLTLIIYRAGKKGLKLDLAVIGLLQLLAFGYGARTIAQARPVFIVAAVDRFIPVYANQLADADLAAASPGPFSRRSWTGPLLVGVNLPKQGQEATDMLMSGLGGKDVELFPRYYVPYDDKASDLMAKAKPVSDLLTRHPAQASGIEQAIQSNGLTADHLVYLPLHGRLGDYSMLISLQTHHPIAAVAVDPW